MRIMQLDFSEREISIIASALGNMPYRDAAPVVASIQMQLQKMDANPQDAAPAKANSPRSSSRVKPDKKSDS